MTTPEDLDEAPGLEPEPGWRPAPDLGIFRRERSFVYGPAGPRIRAAYWLREGDGAFLGKVWFGSHAEGPPGCAHGGAVAAVLDDAMGRAAWVEGFRVLAGRITVDFCARCLLGRVHRVETEIRRDDTRKVVTAARLLAPDGELVAEGEGIFVKVDPAYLDEFLEGRTTDREDPEPGGAPVGEPSGEA